MSSRHNTRRDRKRQKRRRYREVNLLLEHFDPREKGLVLKSLENGKTYTRNLELANKNTCPPGHFDTGKLEWAWFTPEANPLTRGSLYLFSQDWISHSYETQVQWVVGQVGVGYPWGFGKHTSFTDEFYKTTWDPSPESLDEIVRMLFEFTDPELALTYRALQSNSGRALERGLIRYHYEMTGKKLEKQMWKKLPWDYYDRQEVAKTFSKTLFSHPEIKKERTARVRQILDSQLYSSYDSIKLPLDDIFLLIDDIYMENDEPVHLSRKMIDTMVHDLAENFHKKHSSILVKLTGIFLSVYYLVPQDLERFYHAFFCKKDVGYASKGFKLSPDKESIVLNIEVYDLDTKAWVPKQVCSNIFS